MNGDSYPVAGLVRRVRDVAALSRRQLARRAGVAPSTVGRIEAGTLVPTLPTFASILAAAGLSLAVVDDEGRVVLPEVSDLRDAGGRRYPAHLDVIVNPEPHEWWGDRYGEPGMPAVTFHLRPMGEPGTRPLLGDWPIGFRRKRKHPKR